MSIIRYCAVPVRVLAQSYFADGTGRECDYIRYSTAVGYRIWYCGRDILDNVLLQLTYHVTKPLFSYSYQYAGLVHFSVTRTRTSHMNPASSQSVLPTCRHYNITRTEKAETYYTKKKEAQATTAKPNEI